MVSAALGLHREDSLSDFRDLRFGVRADQPGTLLRDFHTAHDDAGRSMPLSERYYLQDAVFLVGLEVEERSRLEHFADGLAHPYFPIFLGRRSCPTDGPVRCEIHQGALEDVLASHIWTATPRYQDNYFAESSERHSQQKTLALQIEPRLGDLDNTAELVNDEPVSFDPRRRLWRGRRTVVLPGIDPAGLSEIGRESNVTSAAVHDPMLALQNSDEHLSQVTKRRNDDAAHEV